MAARKQLSREEQIVRKREKEFRHQKFWNDQRKYYDWWDKTNTKYEDWTSPRYYDTNTQMAKQLQMEKALEERKQIRRQKLMKLFEEDRNAWELELMNQKMEDIHSNKNTRAKINDIPTEILKEIHQGIKEREEEKRKKEAELRLYHQWRSNNSFIQDYEKARRCKDTKMSWLHQQMEKRKRKEKEQAEEKKLLLEREERIKADKEKEERERLELERRNKELKEIIDKQVEEIKHRLTISEKLKTKELEELKQRNELADLEEKERRVCEITKQREMALFNIKQHKRKLKQKLKNIQQNLEEQEKIMLSLKNLEIAEKIQDEQLKSDVKESIEGFLRISEEQKKLEAFREKNLQFVFDSEAEALYQKQCEVWDNEEQLRKNLIKDVLAVVSEQIENNYKKSREKREEVIKEREVLIQMTEEYKRDLLKNQQEEQKKQQKYKEELDRQIKMKQDNKKSIEEKNKLKLITEELERAKVEEERLKREIMNLHRAHGLYKPSNSKNIIF